MENDSIGIPFLFLPHPHSKLFFLFFFLFPPFPYEEKVTLHARNRFLIVLTQTIL